MTWTSLLPWLAAGLVSWVLTGWVRRYALRRSILDIPVERSSHVNPTPRGGGLAIAAVSLGGILMAGILRIMPATVTIGLLGGGLVIAWIGWMDDRQELSARKRLLVHLLGATWFLAWIGGAPPVSIGLYRIDLGLLGTLLAAISIVWFVNLYNFMDGIDGLAAGEAVVVGTFGAGLLVMVGRFDLAVAPLCVAAASAGFLIWNWSPAKIFMGDAGSGMLGFLFISVAFASEAQDAVPLVAWLILLGAFFFDATVTLLRRMIRGEKWREGHRLHAYQRVLGIGWGHSRVSGAILLLTLVLGLFAGRATFSPAHHLAVLAVVVLILAACYLAVERVVPMAAPASAHQKATDPLPPLVDHPYEGSLPTRKGLERDLTRYAR